MEPNTWTPPRCKPLPNVKTRREGHAMIVTMSRERFLFGPTATELGRIARNRFRCGGSFMRWRDRQFLKVLKAIEISE